LDAQEKQQNRALASRRVVCEHVIGTLKVFRILGEKYRNRRRRFGLTIALAGESLQLGFETTQMTFARGLM